MKQPRIDYEAVFQALPGAVALLTTDLVYADANDRLLQMSGRTRDQVVGRYLFDVFPDNPNDPHATGMRNLQASLLRVAATGEPDAMALQRYDVEAPAREREVALILQAAMLPAPRPLGHRRAAVRYRPAVGSLNVCGDWYDLAELPEDRIAVAVGDVVGHGLHAAGVMGQLRSALSAAVRVADGPAAALDRLGLYARDLDGAESTTAVHAVIDCHSSTPKPPLPRAPRSSSTPTDSSNAAAKPSTPAFSGSPTASPATGKPMPTHSPTPCWQNSFHRPATPMTLPWSSSACDLAGHRTPAARAGRFPVPQRPLAGPGDGPAGCPVARHGVREVRVLPSTFSAAPVVAEARSELVKRMRSATSEGWIGRWIRDVGRKRAMNSRCAATKDSASGMRAVMYSSMPSVWVGPDSTELTVTPLRRCWGGARRR
ncbi:PAS domain-containing protein [Streptomyces sp. V4I23]|nr:PAS domain-containing protein [Streptomyces sp. V4I23]